MFFIDLTRTFCLWDQKAKLKQNNKTSTEGPRICQSLDPAITAINLWKTDSDQDYQFKKYVHTFTSIRLLPV